MKHYQGVYKLKKKAFVAEVSPDASFLIYNPFYFSFDRIAAGTASLFT